MLLKFIENQPKEQGKCAIETVQYMIEQKRGQECAHSKRSVSDTNSDSDSGQKSRSESLL